MIILNVINYASFKTIKKNNVRFGRQMIRNSKEQYFLQCNKINECKSIKDYTDVPSHGVR